jgi:hypothetical protein
MAVSKRFDLSVPQRSHCKYPIQPRRKARKRRLADSSHTENLGLVQLRDWRFPAVLLWTQMWKVLEFAVTRAIGNHVALAAAVKSWRYRLLTIGYTTMLLITSYISLLSLLFLRTSASKLCACGWKLRDSNERFTHRLYNDFSKFSRRDDLSHDWLVNGYFRQSDNLAIRLDQQFDTNNVQINGGLLTLKQPGYSDDDLRMSKAISVAGIQSRELKILHGSFRTVMKIEGATGGAVGSFFWYHVRNHCHMALPSHSSV